MSIKSLAGFICSAFTLWHLLSLPVLAARFPNAVEKKIVLSGTEAVEAAKVLGLGAAHPSVSLALGRGDAWAVYLLKHDTKVELLNDNEGCPARQDIVEFSSAATPSLSISPYLLDLGTRHPSPLPGSYSIGSPFLSEKLDSTDSWTQLVRRLKATPQWKADQATEFRRCFSFEQNRSLCIEVLRMEDYTLRRSWDRSKRHP